MTDVGMDFVAAMEAAGTVGFIDLFKVMKQIEWGVALLQENESLVSFRCVISMQKPLCRELRPG